MASEPSKKILVAVDLFDASRYAWHQAGELASVLNVRKEVVYVPRPSFAGNGAARRREALRRLREYLNDGNPLHAHVAPGDPAEVIVRLARDLQPEIVVMGTHGRTGLDRWVLGSVAEAVIRRSSVPVMTVREMARPIDSILVPIALTHYAMTEIAQMIEFASRLGASVTLLHASKDPTAGADPKKTLQDIIRRLPEAVRRRCRARVEISSLDPVEVILSNADRHDMIALVYHRKEPLKDWAFGTTVERVLRRSPVPVLSLPYLRPDSPRRRKLLDEAFGLSKTS